MSPVRGQGVEIPQVVHRGPHTVGFARVLGEDQGLVPLGRELSHPFLDVRQLAGLAGLGIRVANLLEPHNQLQHVLNPHFGSQRLQVHDAFPFRPVIA